MKKRTFFLTSILLLLLAYGIDGAAASARAKHMRLGMIWMKSTLEHRKQVDLLSDRKEGGGSKILDPAPVKPPELGRLKNRIATLIQIQFIVSFCGLAALAVARVRRESGWYWVPILLAYIDGQTAMLIM